MFGYILPDKPNMYMKDYALYKAFYCGMCKSIKQCHKSELLRLSVNYDVTFINVLLHGILGQEMTFKDEACILNPFKKKCILKGDEVSETCVYLNTLLADFKTRDDLFDRPSLGKKFLRTLFKKKIKVAREKLPEAAAAFDTAFDRQSLVEGTYSPSFDDAAEPFANCMQDVFKSILKEKYSEEIGDLAFYLAKYVYLLDAVDDFEKDVKNEEYNPFKYRYKNCKTKKDLIRIPEINEILSGLLYCIKDVYKRIPVFGTESLITNTLWYGLGSRAKEVFEKETKKCIRTHTKF